jgi:uncharacterized protein (DUF1501 family)
MRISRRSFLKGATASAVLAGTHAFGFASRASAAGGADSPILVLIDLSGGNDLLGTVIPIDGAQRILYQALRPDLAVPIEPLAGLSIGADPVRGTGLALHPALTGLHQLYGEDKLALVLGAGLEGNSLSHFEAEKAWFFGQPGVLAEPIGWIGRQLDLANDGLPHAVSFQSEVNPSLQAEFADALGVGSIERFEIPDDPIWEWRDGLARGNALRAILAEPRSGVGETIARSGRLLIDQADFFGGVETLGWGSQLESESSRLGRDLREIASIVRHDLSNPGAASGFGFYHARMGGFDTHSRQGNVDPTFGQPKLLAELSRCLLGFQRDLEEIPGASARVVTLVYSEFGRRAAQNASGAEAGTDHGAGGLLMLLGDRVVGGVHGAMPLLDDLDATGNLKVSTDFRTVYAAVIDDLLGGDHNAVLPGAPFEKLPVIRV